MIRDIGDLVALAIVLRDTAGVVNNAATVTLSVTKPDGSTATPAVTNTAVGGVYTATLTADQAGTWLYRWTAAGAVVSVEESQFSVAPASRVLVASLEEFKDHLGRNAPTDYANDSALRGCLMSSTDWVEWRIGGPLSVQTFTEMVAPAGVWLIPTRRPVVSITSLTPEFGSAIDVANAIVMDTNRNAFRLRWGTLATWYTMVYRAGLSTILERHKFAGLELARHLWLVRNGTSGRGYPGDEVAVPMGFAVPRRVDELLAQDYLPGMA